MPITADDEQIERAVFTISLKQPVETEQRRITRVRMSRLEPVATNGGTAAGK